MERKLMLYIAMSLDGYIAKSDDNIDFLSIVDIPDEDFGYEDFKQNIDTVIWGRKTLDKVLSFGDGVPHKDKTVYVISKSRTGNEQHAIYHNNVVELIQSLKKQEGKNIYCDGGGEIVYELLNHLLIDIVIVSVIPHLLGSGIRLFKDGRPEQKIKLRRSTAYPSGLVQLWYDAEKI
jgi:dihydrofolate reductase